MQNKKMYFICAVFSCMFGMIANVHAVDDVDSMIVEEIDIDLDSQSASAIDDYQVQGSLFQQITDLEQEKILMQLEKERAQLDLELDRLAAEKIKLHMEIDTLSGRAEQQQQEIETQKAKLEAEAARIEREKESWLAALDQETTPVSKTTTAQSVPETETDLSKKYRLVNVVGAGSQLQATVEDLNSGQSRRISVGKTLDGYTVKSISLYDGVVFVDAQGSTQNLNISSGK